MNKKVLTCSCALLLTAAAYAQQSKTVSGTVYDNSTGEPLIGATVREAGTSNGTVTDAEGHYQLQEVRTN